jgi:hypothetical protein
MAKGPKPNQYNRYKRPEHNSGRARTAFNTLKMCAVSLVAIWGAEQGFEKWLDQKADKNSPAAPDVMIPVEVPWNTQGIKPYPDAPSGGEKTTVKTEEKKTPSRRRRRDLGRKWLEKCQAFHPRHLSGKK